MELITHEEMLDKLIGEKGTPRRDKYDKEIEDFLIGEAIKKTRLQQNLTQKDLPLRTGISQANISLIENGTPSPSLNMLKKLAKGTWYDHASGIHRRRYHSLSNNG